MKIDKLFIAAKAFIENKGKILIIRESGKYAPGVNIGLYDVPGGRINPNEKYFDAFKRELQEEIGIKVDIGKPFFVSEWFPKVKGKKWHVVGVFFKCKSRTQKVKLSNDHDDFRWIDPKNYTKAGIINNLESVFREFNKYD